MIIFCLLQTRTVFIFEIFWIGMCSIGVHTDKTGTFATGTNPQCTLMASASVSSHFQ